MNLKAGVRVGFLLPGPLRGGQSVASAVASGNLLAVFSAGAGRCGGPGGDCAPASNPTQRRGKEQQGHECDAASFAQRSTQYSLGELSVAARRRG